MNARNLLCCLLLLFVGCNVEEEGKKSHFEHDHHVDHHWPRNLNDAVRKIRKRIEPQALSEARSAERFAETVDLVSWIPEISADTEITEEQWIPINDFAMQIWSELNASGPELTSDECLQLESLCTLIDTAMTTLERGTDEGSHQREAVQ